MIRPGLHKCICRVEDQAKIRRAIAMRRVDPLNFPPSAKVRAPNQTTSGTTTIPVLSQKKRKAAQNAESSMTQPASQHLLQPTATQSMARETEEEVQAERLNAYEEDPRDELYCILSSKIVGVQYYKGQISVMLSEYYPSSSVDCFRHGGTRRGG